ncbi:tRNA 4-thiouridine(8) synthase ThiI [Candidatus Bathyarchaeota archaeon]|nr:tRNA 4-thiouridine(8) synthase ThiI [Candidatus Bathyarchaeota archaeon]MBS7613896.1 tRNA 4-thiouridine(8) synthase ThiI [Candidatus Bathyarchaeota archaeon]
MGLQWSGVLAAYGELALKSKPVRRRWIRILVSNISRGLTEAGIKVQICHKWSRIVVKTSDVESSVKVLSQVFGLTHIAPFIYVSLNDLENYVAREAVNLLENAESFAVRVKRTGEHGFTSLDLERRLGAILKEKTGVKVSLENPGRTVYVEVHNDECYIYTRRIECCGGLPLSSSGRVVALISTGIDSPVASWLMMKRGCSIIVLHGQVNFDNPNACIHKLLDIVEVLKDWHIGLKIPVYVYKHWEALAEISKHASNYTCVLCKRLMLRVAERLSREIGAKVVVTGESLGQVASQTLDNLNAIDNAVNIPVLRPLIGFNKEEIINLARRIGTYEISIRLYPEYSPETVCWAKPSKPATKTDLEKVLKLERELQIDKLIDRAYETIMEIRQ